MEPHELPPQWWEQLLYFSTLQRPEGADREWLQHAIATFSPVKLGFLMGIPNTLIFFAFGLIDFAILEDNFLGWVFCVGAPIVLLLTTFWPWLRNMRLRQLRRKNSFT